MIEEYIPRKSVMCALDCATEISCYEYEKLEQAVNNIPSPANVREVVFCKDCKYCLKEDKYEYWCNGFCSPARLVTPDDYCSHGVLVGCQNTNCGYCENGECYNLHGIKVKHETCPRGYGK